jgi:hypothetical protein
MGLGDFIKDNANEGMKQFSTPGKAAFSTLFMAQDLKNLATGEERLKSIWNIIKNIVFLKPVMASAFAGMFGAMEKGLRSVLKDTGSLDAALKKLAKIQELQKVFAPFVGGAEQAKRKVAELTNLASSRGLRFDSVAEAAKNLMVLSRGAMGTARDIEKLADIAHYTGESINDLADVTARLYATLREGGTIQGVTEEMRAMNMVSSQAAERLTELQRTGATMGEVFEQAKRSIDEFKGGMTGATEEVRIATEAWEAAKRRLAEGVGSAWAEEDVQNTKNYTAALNALTPTLTALSGALKVVFGGFSTLRSSIAAWIAESKGAQLVIKGVVGGLTALVAVVSVVSGIKLAQWFLSAAMAAKGKGGAVAGLTAQMRAYGAQLIVSSVGNNTWAASAKRATGSAIQWASGLMVVRLALGAMRLMLLATGILAIVQVGSMLVGMFKEWKDGAQKAADEMNRLMSEIDKSSNAFRKQVGEIETLSQMHDKLAESLARVTEAQAEYDQAMAGDDENQKKAAKHKLDRAKGDATAAINRSKGEFFMEDAEIQASIDSAARKKDLRRQQYQQEMSAASPERQAVLRQQEIARLRRESNLANVGVAKEAGYEAEKKKADNAVASATLAIRREGLDENTDFVPDRLMGPLAKARADRAMIGMSPETANKPVDQLTSTEAMAMYRKTRDQKYLIQHGIAKDRESNAAGIESDLQSAVFEQEQGRKAISEGYSQQSAEADAAGLTSEGRQREAGTARIRIKELKRRQRVAAQNGRQSEVNAIGLEIQGVVREHGMQERDFAMDEFQRDDEFKLGEAQLSGDSKGARRIRNRMAALEAYRGALSAGLSPEDAKAQAARSVQQSMTIQARSNFIAAQGVTVADSMRSIGAGGGVATSYATMEDLTAESNDLLTDLSSSITAIQTSIERAKALIIED